jgi:hypothetical protein
MLKVKPKSKPPYPAIKTRTYPVILPEGRNSPAVLAPVVDNDGLDNAVSGLVIDRECLIGESDDAQPRNREQSRDKNRREHCALCLHLDVWSESGAVGPVTVDPPSALLTPNRVLELPEGAVEACLIALLPHRSADYGPD